MKATVLDLRRNTRKIIEAIGRNEEVTLTFRGKEIATIVPKPAQQEKLDMASMRYFGMWADREDMADPAAYVRELRKSRYRDL